MAPGPIILTALRKLKSGGTGRSVTFQAGPVPDEAGKWDGSVPAEFGGVLLLLVRSSVMNIVLLLYRG